MLSPDVMRRLLAVTRCGGRSAGPSSTCSAARACRTRKLRLLLRASAGPAEASSDQSASASRTSEVGHGRAENAVIGRAWEESASLSRRRATYRSGLVRHQPRPALVL